MATRKKLARSHWCMFVLIGLGACRAVAASPPADDVPTAKIDDLAWLAGTWVQATRDVHTEEHWLAPKGGIMLGVSRTVGGNRTSFEFLRITQADTGLVYLASPQGREPTEFRLTSLKDKRVVFANAKHDFPQEISYWLDEQGDLRARVSGSLRGQQRALDFHWQRPP